MSRRYDLPRNGTAGAVVERRNDNRLTQTQVRREASAKKYSQCPVCRGGNIVTW
jgi:hypothetical protein